LRLTGGFNEQSEYGDLRALDTLRAVSAPSADIEERISGIGDGEKLRVIWPGSGWDSGSGREHGAVSDDNAWDLRREIERMATFSCRDPANAAQNEICAKKLIFRGGSIEEGRGEADFRAVFVAEAFSLSLNSYQGGREELWRNLGDDV
jgi:hypothetical protein